MNGSRIDLLGRGKYDATVASEESETGYGGSTGELCTGYL